MFMSYEVFATFGISAILSFTISATLLLIVVAKRGLLRVGAGRKAAANLKLAGGPLLLPLSAPPMPMTVELAPLKDYPK